MNEFLVTATLPGTSEQFTQICSGKAVIGRSGESDIQLSHRLVSRRHAEVSLDEEGRFLIRDLGSRNGTMVNDISLGDGPLLLGDHPTMQIGPYSLLLTALDEGTILGSAVTSKASEMVPAASTSGHPEASIPRAPAVAEAVTAHEASSVAEDFALKPVGWPPAKATPSSPSSSSGMREAVHYSRFVYICVAAVAVISIWFMTWEDYFIMKANGLHTPWGWVAFLAAFAFLGIVIYDAVNRRNRRLIVWAIVVGVVLVFSLILEVDYITTMCGKNDIFCMKPAIGSGPFLTGLAGASLIVLPFFIDRKNVDFPAAR